MAAEQHIRASCHLGARCKVAAAAPAPRHAAEQLAGVTDRQCSQHSATDELLVGHILGAAAVVATVVLKAGKNSRCFGNEQSHNVQISLGASSRL